MSKFKYIIIGLLITGTIALFVWGINYLKGKNFFIEEETYYVVYDRIDGLTSANAVTINGLKVGQVREVYFHPNGSGKIIVSFVLVHQYNIPDSSVALIYSADLMGSKAIMLQLTNSTNYYKSGDTLFSAIEKDIKDQVSAQMLPLKVKAEDLMLSIDSVMNVIQYIFNDATRKNLSKTFENIKLTITNLKSASVSLDSMMYNEKDKLALIFSNVESITSNLKENNEQITNILANFSSLSDTLAKSEIVSTINNANLALTRTNDILSMIERGEGSMGMLINNDSLYNNLNKAAYDLNKLMFDIKDNPKRYLHFSIFDFGKTVIVDENGTKIRRKRKNKDTGDNPAKVRIQIRSSLKQIPNFANTFKEFDDVEELFIDGRYKYFVGDIYSYSEVIPFQKYVRVHYPDAFAVGFKDDEQISLHKAKKEML